MCTECGHTYIGNGSCPRCGGLAKSNGHDDMTKKTFDEPDLKKGW